MDISKKIQKILGRGVRENVNLADYTTMKVGGAARYFYVADDIKNFMKAIIFIQDEKIPYIIIGGGSNIIVSDKGFDGLVILNKASNISFIPEKAQVIVDSGVSLMRLIMESANRDLGGIECLYGIPGTVGGAVYGNAGSNETEIASFIKSITLIDSNNKIIRVKPDWLMADYRSTKLKNLKKSGKKSPIILTVTFQLSHHKKEEISRKIQYFKVLREEKQPYNKPSAGSIFKNVGREKEKRAGYILDQVGAKKLKVGGAEVSKKHANFIVNFKNATSGDIIELIEGMKKLAHDNYGVELEEEVELI